MTRLSDEELARLLRRPRPSEPPPGLADRIKAEIPEHIAVGGRGSGGRLRSGPGGLLAARPLWLMAASLLVVIGVGFMAVQLIPPARDLAHEIAMDGVAVPEPYEIIVPPRWSVELDRARRPGATPSPSASPVL